MAMERSPYEGTFDRTGKACVGRVVGIDAEARFLRVKTFGGIDDLDLYNVRILHGFWHPEGDESVCIPRLGTLGVVLFVGSESFWLGAYPGLMSSGQGQRANMESLQEGDIHFKTHAGNMVTLRRGGIVEVKSTDLCSVLWTPTENLIKTICQNYRIETSGGRLEWTLDKEDSDNTNLKIRAWNNLNPDNGIELDIGTIPDANDEDSSGDIKPYSAGDLILDFRQGTLTDEKDMDKRTFRVSVKKDGSLFLDVGPSKFSMTIDAATGDVQFETKGSVKGKVVKDVALTVEGAVTAKVTKDIALTAEAGVTATVKGKLTATVKGDVAVTSDGKATVSAKGGADIKSDGAVKVDAGGDATLSAKGNVNVKGSQISVKGDSQVSVDAPMVALAGGGVGVARLGDTAMGVGNMGAPVICTINKGSAKVTAGG